VVDALGIAVGISRTDLVRVGHLERAVDALASYVRGDSPDSEKTSRRINNLRAALASVAGGIPAEEIPVEDLRERLIAIQERAEAALSDDEKIGAHTP
jgi:hypothetical protein